MDFFTTLVNGLSLGGIYAMIALGYTMVYGIAKMLNFAHGDVIMVGSYVIVLFSPLVTVTGSNVYLSLIATVLVAIVFCMALGIVIEKFAYKPLRGASPLAVLITAIGVSYLLQSLVQMKEGSAPKIFTPPALGNLKIGFLSMSYYTVITLACSIVVMVALSLFVKFSKTGRAMVAVSEDKGAAQLMGINVNRIIMITFAIGSALAALAGFFYLIKANSTTPTFGSLPGIIAFSAAVIGGIGSIPGAMLGGILLGVIETFADAIPVLSPYKYAIEFSILIILLLVKPSGLLGKLRREKV